MNCLDEHFHYTVFSNSKGENQIYIFGPPDYHKINIHSLADLQLKGVSASTAGCNMFSGNDLHYTAILCIIPILFLLFQKCIPVRWC